MGASTDAARAEVLARRRLLLDEVTHLEASARAAADIPAKVKRAPVQTAGLAAGTAFFVLGGPQRLYRRARRAILGPKADMPKSMLPKEVDKRLRSMGDDGEKVRRTLEREFADYLDEHRQERESRDLGATAVAIAGSVLRPGAGQLGRRMASELVKPDSASFGGAVERIRARREAGKGAGPGVSTTDDAGRPPSGSR